MNEGKPKEADVLLRTLVGHGLTKNDPSTNITQEQIHKLRKHATARPLTAQGLTVRAVQTLQRKHRLPGEIRGRGRDWEWEVADEREMKLVSKVLPDLGGYRTGWGAWILRPGYTDKGEWGDPSSQWHRASAKFRPGDTVEIARTHRHAPFRGLHGTVDKLVPFSKIYVNIHGGDKILVDEADLIPYRGGFRIQVFEDVSSPRPSWTGDLEDFMQGNEDLDPDIVSMIHRLRPGQSEKFDMGAGGLWKIRRIAHTAQEPTMVAKLSADVTKREWEKALQEDERMLKKYEGYLEIFKRGEQPPGEKHLTEAGARRVVDGLRQVIRNKKQLLSKMSGGRMQAAKTMLRETADVLGVRVALDQEVARRAEKYAELVQEAIVKHYAAHLPNITPPKITIDRGPKYWRIVKNDEISRSVHTFVDMENGDILKAKGWKEPERKNPRGNVRDPDYGMRGVTQYGAVYLRASEVRDLLREASSLLAGEEARHKVARHDRDWADGDRSAPRTPWGQAQFEYKIVPGVSWFSTASHGGMRVSPSVARKLLSPAAIKHGEAWGGAFWYEEDVAYLIPFLENPEWDQIAARKMGSRVGRPEEHERTIRQYFPRYFKLREEGFKLPDPPKVGDLIRVTKPINMTNGVVLQPGEEFFLDKVTRALIVFAKPGDPYVRYSLRMQNYLEGDVVKVAQRLLREAQMEDDAPMDADTRALQGWAADRIQTHAARLRQAAAKPLRQQLEDMAAAMFGMIGIMRNIGNSPTLAAKADMLLRMLRNAITEGAKANLYLRMLRDESREGP